MIAVFRHYLIQSFRAGAEAAVKTILLHELVFFSHLHEILEIIESVLSYFHT